LKAIGDMQERMRSVAIILRNDLKYDHFDEVRGNRLSDQDLRTQPPPDNGYFRIWQQSPHPIPPAPAPQPGAVPPQYNPYLYGSIAEGVDGDGVPVTRATQSWMAFTVHLHGQGRDNYLSGSLPTGANADAAANAALQQNAPADVQQPNTMLSQWAEVAYFLRP